MLHGHGEMCCVGLMGHINTVGWVGICVCGVSGCVYVTFCV